MKRIFISLWFVCSGVLLIPIAFAQQAITVSLIDVSNDNQILENGDGIYFDINLSEPLDSDTLVKLDLNASVATPLFDFKLRYQMDYADLEIDQNNKASLIIPSGETSIRIFAYSLYDCVDEDNEQINIAIGEVNNNVSLGTSVSVSTFIEDNNDVGFYYVSTTGDDSNDGSCRSPVKSLSTALYRFRNNHKTTLILKAGTYTEVNNKHVFKSGTKDKPIVIRAEHPNSVFLVGTRKEDDLEDQGEYGLMIQEASYVTVKDISFSNFGTGLQIFDGEVRGRVSNIIVDNCTFDSNGSAGVELTRAKNVVIKNSVIIGRVPDQNLCLPEQEVCAIQDYGVVVHQSDDTMIRDNYFYGYHNQMVSFKEDDHNGIVERNVFVGSMLTAIYLGQDYDAGNPQSSDLIARYNIVLGQDNLPVKSPISIDNVNNATVEHNFFKDFDYSNNKSSIYIQKRVTGDINIKNNIIAFGLNTQNSGAFEIEDKDGCPDPLTNISISENIVYKVHHALSTISHQNDGDNSNINNCYQQANMHNNIFYKLFGESNYEGDIPLNYTPNTNINPGFINDPVEQNYSFGMESVDFDSLYQHLTEPFIIN